MKNQNIEPPRSFLEFVMPITSKELKQAHYELTAETEQEALEFSSEFRARQPGIYSFVPCTAATPDDIAYENSLVCAFARRLCAAIENKFGIAPVLTPEELQAANTMAAALLKDHTLSDCVQNIPAFQFAERGILGCRMDGDTAAPVRNRVSLKVLTLLICFNDALSRDGPQAAAMPATNQSASNPIQLKTDKS